MVDHDRERWTVARAEGLRQGCPAAGREGSIGQGCRGTQGLSLVGAMDQGNPDGIGAGTVAGIDNAPVGTRLGCPQGRDELGQGRIRPETIVFDFHQSNDVGVEQPHLLDQLGLLALILVVTRRAALGRKAAAATVTVEQIQDIQCHDPQDTRLTLRRRRPFGLSDIGRRIGQLQPVAAMPVVEQPFDAGQRGADPPGGRGVRLVGQIPDSFRITPIAAIIENQHSTGVVGSETGRFRARCNPIGRLLRQLAEGDGQGTEGLQFVMAGHDQRPRQAQAHAFQRFPLAGLGRRLADLMSRHAILADHLPFDIDQGGQTGRRVAQFIDPTAQGEQIAALRHRPIVACPADEQALGGRRITIILPARTGHEEPAQAAEIAAHHATGLVCLAQQRASFTGALDRRDGHDRPSLAGRGLTGRDLTGRAFGTGGQQCRQGQDARSDRPGHVRDAIGAGVGMIDGKAGVRTYFRLSIIQSTVAATCSSFRAGLPPRAGISPAAP